jgi:hypothetical protein
MFSSISFVTKPTIQAELVWTVNDMFPVGQLYLQIMKRMADFPKLRPDSCISHTSAISICNALLTLDNTHEDTTLHV